MLKLNKRFVRIISNSMQDFTDIQEYKNGSVRWSCKPNYTFAEQIEADLHRYRSQSKRFEQITPRRRLSLTDLCLAKIPPSARDDIPSDLHERHAVLWKRATAREKFKTKGKFACEFAQLFYPKKYPDATLDMYYSYASSKTIDELGYIRWEQVYDFLRTEHNATELAAYGLVKDRGDRYGFDYTLISTIHGKHYNVNVDIAVKRRCDVCIFGESPTWLHVKKYACNPYIDLFPELEWVPKHQLLLPRVLSHNPYI